MAITWYLTMSSGRKVQSTGALFPRYSVPPIKAKPGKKSLPLMVHSGRRFLCIGALFICLERISITVMSLFVVPATVEPPRFLVGRSQYRAALKPFPGKWDRTDRAPAAPKERNRHEYQDRPPGNPHKDNAEVMASHWRADQPCDDSEEIPSKHDNKHSQLWVSAFECSLYEWTSGELNL